MSSTTDKAVLLGGLTVLAGALAYGATQSRTNEETLPEVSKAADVATFPKEIKDELHSRVKTFFNEDGFEKLQDSFVVVRSYSFAFSTSDAELVT